MNFLLKILGGMVYRALFGAAPQWNSGLEEARASTSQDTVDILAQFDDGRWRLIRSVMYLNDQYVIGEARSVQQSMGLRVKMVSRQHGLVDILD